MTQSETREIAVRPAELLTAGNVRHIVADYPFAIRKALEFATHLEFGELDMQFPDGRVFRVTAPNAGPRATMIVHDLGFAGRLSEGDIGIAESYLRGQWDSPDLTKFLHLFCANQPLIATMLKGRPFVRFLQMVQHWVKRNTRAGARRNIHAHYDLGNRFYSAWLDRTMTYSSALFDGSRDLATGQIGKFRALLDRTGVTPDHHVLEIGCGWGGFAEYAARTIGCRVTGLTISQEQYEFASRRIYEAGLNEKVTIALRDYRDETGTFDRIASIEMFEAVGEAYWPTFFSKMRDRLVTGGIAGLQVITIQEPLFHRYRRELDFIRRYVFPGGMLPTPTIMRDLAQSHEFTLSAERVFGHDYALTLAQWRDRFRAAWPNLTTLGFDERFRRLWEYYLAYCEAGFLSGTIDVRQMIFARAS